MKREGQRRMLAATAPGSQVMPNTPDLAKELETYAAHKDELVRKAEGQFVVIHGDRVVNTWDTFEDALKAGYDEFGLERFLIKQIEGIEQVHFCGRDLTCQS